MDTTAPATFIGLDLETTGLHDHAEPLEIGMIAYTDQLEELDVFHRLILPAPFADLYASASPEARSMHTRTGLWTELAARQIDGDTADLAPDAVDRAAGTWVRRHTGETAPFILGTNPTYDRGVLADRMPDLLARFHYQMVDANSIKLIARHTYRCMPPAGTHTAVHRAVEDVRDSVRLIRDALAGILTTRATRTTPGVRA